MCRAWQDDLPGAADAGRDDRAVFGRRRWVVGAGDHKGWRLDRTQIGAQIHVGYGQAAARIAGGVGALEFGDERRDRRWLAIGERGGEPPASRWRREGG